MKFITHRTKKILKPFGEKKGGHLKGMRTTLASMESRRSWNNFFKVLRVLKKIFYARVLLINNFRWTAKVLSHTYPCNVSPSNSLPSQAATYKQSSLCYTISLCWLSILSIEECILNPEIYIQLNYQRNKKFEHNSTWNTYCSYTLPVKYHSHRVSTSVK